MGAFAVMLVVRPLFVVWDFTADRQRRRRDCSDYAAFAVRKSLLWSPHRLACGRGGHDLSPGAVLRLRRSDSSKLHRAQRIEERRSECEFDVDEHGTGLRLDSQLWFQAGMEVCVCTKVTLRPGA